MKRLIYLVLFFVLFVFHTQQLLPHGLVELAGLIVFDVAITALLIYGFRVVRKSFKNEIGRDRFY